MESKVESKPPSAEIIPFLRGGERVGAGADQEAEVRILARAFARLDKVAFGLAAGTVSGAIVFIATLWLLIKGGSLVGPNLSLLSQFFPAYEVTWAGAGIGLVYGFVFGFVFGWTLALAKNLFIARFLRHARFEQERAERRRFLDYV